MLTVFWFEATEGFGAFPVDLLLVALPEDDAVELDETAGGAFDPEFALLPDDVLPLLAPLLAALLAPLLVVPGPVAGCTFADCASSHGSYDSSSPSQAAMNSRTNKNENRIASKRSLTWLIIFL